MSKYYLTHRVAGITGSTGGLGSKVATALFAQVGPLGIVDLDVAKVEAQADALGGPFLV
ncbi:hypothetical protein PQU63_05330 [Xanthomonas protegens]|uniref:Uncharacterized protein n=1 Tax=Xanthomonas protegens TaxID=3380705 RepID=A0ABU9L9R0_9XANT